MAAEYPNLDLLELVFSRYIVEHSDIDKTYVPDCEAFVFPQTWPNTGGGMAKAGYMYGQSMTKEYTTVFIDIEHQHAMVAFGNDVAYFVNHLNSKFFEDFKNYDMKGWRQRHYYDDNNES